MARKKKSTAEKKSALAIALEEGKPVKGMTGYVRMLESNLDYDDEEREGVFVKVKCLGLSTGNGCGVEILVEPLSGEGQFTLSPCKWIDTPEDMKRLVDIAKRRRQAVDDFRKLFNRQHYQAAKALALETYVDERMTKEQQAEFRSHVDTQIGEGKKLKSANNDTLRNLTKTAVAVVNGLTADQTPDTYSW